MHFSWQRIDITGANVGLPMPIGDGVRTRLPARLAGNSEWTLDWDTTLFPDGPGYLIAVVENCAGADQDQRQQAASSSCPTYILNTGPTCAADAIQAPAFGDTWQIGQGWQWTLPPARFSGNANGFILWDPNKIQGVFPPTDWAFAGPHLPELHLRGRSATSRCRGITASIGSESSWTAPSGPTIPCTRPRWRQAPPAMPAIRGSTSTVDPTNRSRGGSG